LYAVDGTIRDLSAIVGDIDGSLFSDGFPRSLQGINPDSLPLVDSASRIGPCVAGVGKFIFHEGNLIHYRTRR